MSAQSCLFVTPWTVARQAPLSMGFPRQEYWSGLPFPSPGDLPEPGIQTLFSVSPALAGEFFTTAPPRKYKLLMNTLKCSNGEYGFSLFFSIEVQEIA